MTGAVLSDMTSSWSVPGAALTLTAEPRTFFGEVTEVGRLSFAGGGAAYGELVPARPFDLSGFEELRLWVRATARADGTARRPFRLAVSFADGQDRPGEQHRWFVPFQADGGWELHRIGIENERRGAVTRIRLETLGTGAFTVWLSQLRAVREEVPMDVERALIAAWDGVRVPGLDRVPVREFPAASALRIPLTPGFAAGNRVRVEGLEGSPVTRDVSRADHEPGAGRTTLELTAALDAPFVPGTTVRLLAPMTKDAVAPRLRLSFDGLRDDPQRSGQTVQQDSFRLRGQVIECSVRPAARACTADYLLTVEVGGDPIRAAALAGAVARCFSADRPLWIDGSPVPLRILPPPHGRRSGPVADRAAGGGNPAGGHGSEPGDVGTPSAAAYRSVGGVADAHGGVRLAPRTLRG